MVTRRQVLSSFGQMAIAGAVLGALAACTPAVPGAAPTAASRSALSNNLKLPTYTAFNGPKPDVEGTSSGVPPSYSVYPKTPIKTVKGPIGNGEDVTLSGKFIGAPVTPMEQNAAWQEMNRQLGFNLKFQMYPQADYPTRLQTLIAGNQLPDIFVEQFQASTMQSEPEFLEAQCADLTPFLGLLDPDTPSGASANAFYGGKWAAYPNSFIAFDAGWTSALQLDPDFKPRIVTPFSADGSVKAVYHTGLGQSGRAALRKVSPERVKQLLGILNYFTAPFGSQEYLLLYFGANGVDWTMNDQGNPVQTQQGTKDVLTTNLWFPFVTPPDALYAPALGDYVSVLRQAEMESYALAVPNPVVGLYSKTDASQGTSLTQRITDTVVGIAYGRENIGALDQVVRDWRANGGNQIRSEYEAALQAAA